MVKFINQDRDAPKKNVLLFIHGFVGSEESWLGKDNEVRIPAYLHSDKYIAANYDFAVFSYYTKLSSILDNLYTSYRLISDKIFISRWINKLIVRRFVKKKIEFKANLHIDEISEILKTDANGKLKNYERIIIIAHSMGGLVAKSFILDILERSDKSESASTMSKKIAGYISIAVPHNGSNLANIGQAIQTNPQIQDLAPLENFLYKLTNRWLLSKMLPLTAYFQCKADNIVGKNSSIGYDIRNIEPEFFEYDHFTVLRPEKDDTIIEILINTIRKFETDDPKDYYYKLINYLVGTKDDGEAALKSYVVNHENKAFRNGKFEELKNKAECSITIMGVGITNIDTAEIESYLNNGISVRLLMMNPNILLEHFSFNQNSENNFDYLSAFDMMLKNNHLGKFYDRKKYNIDLIASFLRLEEFVRENTEKYNSNSKKGNIEMKVFNSFIPLSFTSINTFNTSNKERFGKEEFIVEFALPYSDKRIHIPILKDNDIKIFNSFVLSIDNLWDNSTDLTEIEIREILLNSK
ncbi:MAG: hypothetical protein QM535_17510 [Limnohabitans sp.]|nr:hypothetical protein [Limnohabitans sp.]